MPKSRFPTGAPTPWRSQVRYLTGLVSRYGKAAVLSASTIFAGRDFRTHIDTALKASDVLLVSSDPSWLSASKDGRSGSTMKMIWFVLKWKRPDTGLAGDRCSWAGQDARSQRLLNEGLYFRNAMEIDSGQDFDLHLQRLVRNWTRAFLRRGKFDGGRWQARLLSLFFSLARGSPGLIGKRSTVSVDCGRAKGVRSARDRGAEREPEDCSIFQHPL